MSYKIWSKGNILFYFSLFYHYTLMLYFYSFKHKHINLRITRLNSDKQKKI
jgi:hypothetical protein